PVGHELCLHGDRRGRRHCTLRCDTPPSDMMKCRHIRSTRLPDNNAADRAAGSLAQAPQPLPPVAACSGHSHHCVARPSFLSRTQEAELSILMLFTLNAAFGMPTPLLRPSALPGDSG